VNAEFQSFPVLVIEHNDSASLIEKLLTSALGTASHASSISNQANTLSGDISMPTCAELEVPDVRHPHRSPYMVTPIDPQPIQADSQPLIEMESGSVRYSTAELSQHQTLPASNDRNLSQSPFIPMHERQFSGISAISTDSSARYTSMSSFAASRQVSGMSSDLNYTPATSISLGDGSAVPNPDTLDVSPIKRPELSVDTHLMPPPNPNFADAITDSPSEMDDDTQGCQRPAAEWHPGHRLETVKVDDCSDPWIPTSSAVYDPVLPGIEIPVYEPTNTTGPQRHDAMTSMDEGKERVLGSPFTSPAPSSKSFLYQPFDSSTNLDVAARKSPWSSPDPGHGDRRRERAAELLQTFDSFADSKLHGHSQDSLILCLQECFDISLSYFCNSSPRLVELCSALGTPSVENALSAFASIMSDGGAPTSLQLISLAFFGLSLICLSLEDDAVEGAMSALHLNARSWSACVDPSYQGAFEQVVDELWLPVRTSHLIQHLRHHAFVTAIETESTQPMWWWADDFILQLAERFVACKHPQPPHSTIC
jgi:hypothetical protein